MKSKHLLLTLLMALLVPWAANAQETVTIGEGTATCNTNPIGTYYNYSITEQLYTAEEIGMAGTINSVSFYYRGIAAKDLPITMYMKHVDEENLASGGISLADADEVFSGTLSVTTTAGWVTINLDTPFDYDGTSNLLIGFIKDYLYYFNGQSWQGTATTATMARYTENDDNAYTTSTTPGTAQANRPNIQIVIETANPECPKPNNLVASNVTAHTADLTWESEATQFMLQYKKVSDESWNSVYLEDEGTSYQLTNLIAETTYQARVAAHIESCGSDPQTGDDIYSDWRDIEFTTGIACPAPTNLDVTDGSITAHEATVTWTGTSDSYVVMIGQENLFARANFETGDLSQADFTSTTSYPFTVVENTHSGSYCAVNSNCDAAGLDMYNGTTSDMVLEVTLSADATLSFSAKVSSESSWDKAYFSIDGAVKINAISGNGNWIDYSYPLTAGTHTLRWYYTKDGSGYSNDDCFYVDDIVITAGVASWTEYTTTNQTYPFENLTPNRSYQVKVKGNCGDDGYSQESAPVGFTTLASCIAPTGLAMVAGYPTAHEVSFTWDYQTGEVFQFALVQGHVTDPAEVNFNTTWNAGDDFPMWNTLSADTDWSFFLRKNCAGDFSDPVYVYFHTLEACPAPTGFAAMPNSITAHTANLTWQGTSNSYQVAYRTAAYVDGLEEGFGSTSAPEGWTRYQTLLTDDVLNGTTALTTYAGGWVFGTSNGVFDRHARVNIYGTSCKYWLVTPTLTVPAGAALSFDLALTAFSGSNVPAPSTTGTDDRFIVLISTDEMATWNILREWNNSGSTYVYNNIANTATGENVNFDFSAYAGQTVYVAFYGESTVSNADNYLHIDNVTIGTPVEAGSWQENETNESPYIISGLEPGTKYDLKVAPICDETLVSEIQQFTTASENEKYFITEGNWGTAANWEPAGVPTIEQTVELRANATIESGCVAEAKSISGTGTGDNAKTLTIEDGGQLKHNSSNVRATVKKNITGYTDEWDHYYLISNPLTSTVYNHTSSNTPNISTTGMLTDAYDLYDWSYSNEGQEWRNYEASTFNLSTGLYGYLYASATDNELTFTGTVRASNNSQSRSTNASSYYAWGNWSLLGNPFVCNAYLVGASTNGTSLPYYRLTADGFEAVESGAIAPMEGFFYENTSGSSKTVYMIRTAPDDLNNGTLNINLRGNNKQLDNAIIRFGEGEQLGKFSFREGSTKIYIPMDGKDFAIVNAGQVGEMPVSFKAETNGSYTLNFASKEVSFSYLHLIDNMTGADVDLLETPTYTFSAKTTDYASRFRLVFATGSSVDGDSFAFINGMGNLSIFGIEGEATVQVMDVLGHMVSSNTFSGSYECKLNVAPGVYMIRLIQGNDVKVQKMVIR